MTSVNTNVSSIYTVPYKIVRKRTFPDRFYDYHAAKKENGFYLLDFLTTSEFQVDFLWDDNHHNWNVLKHKSKLKEGIIGKATRRQSWNILSNDCRRYSIKRGMWYCDLIRNKILFLSVYFKLLLVCAVLFWRFSHLVRRFRGVADLPLIIFLISNFVKC